MVAVKRIPKEAWALLSEQAHAVVFGERKPASWDAIDYALVTEDATETLRAYVTCRKLSPDAVYIQYGGAFPTIKRTQAVVGDFLAILQRLANDGVKSVGFLVENTNFPMLKLAMAVGFFISGVRFFEGSILVEHYLKLGGE